MKNAPDVKKSDNKSAIKKDAAGSAFDLKKLRQHLNLSPATDLKYMSYSSEAVMLQTPGLHRLLLLGISALIFIMLIWAYFAEVDEFTRGEGRIVPSSDVQIVQNLEGGILAKLHVTEGELVERNQPLMQIDDTLFSSTFRERALQVVQLTAKAARLRAEAQSTSFDEELAKIDVEMDETLAQSERQLFRARANEFQSRVDALRQKVEQKRQELSSARGSRQNLANSYELLSRELSVTRPLVAEGAVSAVELLRLERQVNDLKGELNRARLAIPQLEAEYQEAQNNAEGFAQNFANEARKELNEVTSELDRYKESNQAYKDRVARTIVRSPVRGTVKQIKVKTVGGVIQPGADLVEIVPIDDSLLVDAKVRPADIAYLHPNQKATVKFTAYDFSIHGGLGAKVVLISPDTIVDEEGVSYYQVRLQTESSSLGKEGEDPLPIIPGMTVQVDILTGKKTVLDYILKPILKTKQLAFRER